MILTYVFTALLFVGGNNFVAVSPPVENLTVEQCTEMALDVNTSIDNDRPVIGVCAPRLTTSM